MCQFQRGLNWKIMGNKNIRKDKNRSFFSATNNHQDSALFLFANKLLKFTKKESTTHKYN